MTNNKQTNNSNLAIGYFDGDKYTYDPIYVGKHLKELRMKANLTQYELADLIGGNTNQIKMWESGNNMPPLSIFHYMSRVIFKTSLSFLLNGEEDIGCSYIR